MTIAIKTITPEQRLAQLGIVLPAVSAPRGNFDAYVLDGGLLYLSGKGSPLREDVAIVPKVGREITAEEARQHARTVGLHLIATMQAALGNLSRVRRVVKVLGMVNATPDFMQHTEVVNGCSDLLVEVFGENGKKPKYRDVPGLCKAATLAEIEAQGWSLNPGRYVGVAAGEEVSDEDFKAQFEALNEELERLTKEARGLEERIAVNAAEILGA